MNPPSIREHLLWRCGLGVGLLMCLLSVAVYLLVQRSLFSELDDSIAQTAALLANQVELEDESIIFEWEEGLGTNQDLSTDALFQFWEEKTGNTTRSPGLEGRDLPRFVGSDDSPLCKSIQLPKNRRGRAIGLRVFPFVLPEEMAKMEESDRMIDPKSMPFTLVVARDAEPVHRTLEQLRWVLICGCVLTLGLGFLLIDRVVRVSLRPIDALTSQMKERGSHQLDRALDVPAELPSELAGLAETFDSLLSRVAATRERERDFIRHAAHELRTPIASLRATTDLALSQERDAPTYAAHLATCQKTAGELSALVTRLSSLSRLGSGAQPALNVKIDLTSMMRDCLDPFIKPFEKKGMKMHMGLSQTPLMAMGDPTLIRIVFNNLLDNVLCYASAASEIRIQGDVGDREVEIRISNQAEHLPENPERMFEPLFRNPSSRNDAGSHLGIGLTLSLEAANTMGGSLGAQRLDGGRIEFIFRIPKAE